MRHAPDISVFFVPHAPTVSAQQSRIQGDRASATRKRIEARHQKPAQQSDLVGQSVGQGLKTPRPGATTGKTAIGREHGAQTPHLRGGFLQSLEEFVRGVEAAHDHDDQSFIEQLLRVELGAPTFAAGADIGTIGGRSRGKKRVDGLDKRDKNRRMR